MVMASSWKDQFAKYVFWLLNVINVLVFCPRLLLTQVTELENLPQDASRSAYTQRILEIVSNIKKQKEEITKVCLKPRTEGILISDFYMSYDQTSSLHTQVPDFYTPVAIEIIELHEFDYLDGA